MTFHSLRFDRAAATYGGHARIQERMADVLSGLLPDDGAGAILEMGCGTGLLTDRLVARYPSVEVLATDASPRMLEASRSNPKLVAYQAASALHGQSDRSLRWHLFDASGEADVPEAIRADGPYGLAASSALVQWFPDLRPHFSLVSSLLRPSGAYLVSGFSRDNFPELNAILREPPFSYASYPGHYRGEIETAAAAAGFECAAYEEESIPFVLPSAKAFLESIRGLGSARRPDEEKPLTRSRLRFLVETYQERYSVEGGVRATWKPWYARLRKPG
jgi:malonyl-CoA O-methyltransferase